MCQKIIFFGVIIAIRNGDIKKPLHQIAKRPAGLGKHRGDFAGIAVKPRNILTRKVEDTGGVVFFCGGDREYFPKGGDLVPGHAPVGLGHLGTQRNHRDGKGDRTFGRRAQTVEDLAQRFAISKRLKRFAYAGPDRHPIKLQAGAANVRSGICYLT